MSETTTERIPANLLARVVSTYQVMYLDPARLTALLREAIDTYQDKAGFIRTAQFGDHDTEIQTPADLLEVIGVVDAEGRRHEYTVGVSSIAVIQQRKSVTPYALTYFVNLRGVDIDAGTLPAEIIGILAKYLTALIDMPNTQRARQIASATGLQVEYPTDEELRARKENIELEIEESQAIIPMMTVY